MTFKLITTLALLSFGVVHAHDLTLKMTLTPAGSFEAKTIKLHGEAVKSGNKITAENLWVKIEDLKTGIDLRDEHFHKHLNFEKSPKATFSNIVAENGTGTGTLTVNGVANKVNFTYKPVGDKKIAADFKVKPSAFNLKEAKYLEIGVDDDVNVEATIDLK